MFLAQAHSFTQQARLAITLAWVAGYTNVITILLCGHVTSHVSGTTSDLGRASVEAIRGASGAWGLAGFAFFLVVTFFFGAALSGASTELGRRRGWESIYVLPMAFEAALLAAFGIAVQVHGAAPPAVLSPGSSQLAGPPIASGVWLYWLTGLASMAMGLQNATITRISSGVVRTTHVTGVLTDLGLEVVQFAEWIWDRRVNIPPGSLRGMIHSARNHATPRRLALLVSILGSFALGAGLGALAFDHITGVAMYLPVLFLMWIIYQDVTQPIAEIEPFEIIGGEKLVLPDTIAIYHLRRDSARGQRGAHRLPSLRAWSERLPRTVWVAILDLHEVTQLDDDAASDIRETLARFRVEHRHLLLAGVSEEQYEQLRRDGAGDLLHPENACADIEIAIARGLNVVEDMRAGRPFAAG